MRFKYRQTIISIHDHNYKYELPERQTVNIWTHNVFKILITLIILSPFVSMELLSISLPTFLIVGSLAHSEQNSRHVNLVYSEQPILITRNCRSYQSIPGGILPGDVLMFKEGHHYPVDGFVVEVSGVFVNEFTITGVRESMLQKSCYLNLFEQYMKTNTDL